jgi:hypothetical protein
VKNKRMYIAIFAFAFALSLILNVYLLRSHKDSGFSPMQAGLHSGLDTLMQAAALCDVAKEHLREHWSNHKPEIEKVIHVVNNKAEMTSKMKTDLNEMGQAMALNPEQFSDFSRRYEAIYFPHVDQFREKLNTQSPDWSGMFATLKDFYAVEDKLVLNSLGKESLEKFRNSQTKKRTTMLALIGQYAEVPWDSSIAW